MNQLADKRCSLMDQTKWPLNINSILASIHPSVLLNFMRNNDNNVSMPLDIGNSAIGRKPGYPPLNILQPPNGPRFNSDSSQFIDFMSELHNKLAKNTSLSPDLCGLYETNQHMKTPRYSDELPSDTNALLGSKQFPMSSDRPNQFLPFNVKDICVPTKHSNLNVTKLKADSPISIHSPASGANSQVTDYKISTILEEHTTVDQSTKHLKNVENSFSKTFEALASYQTEGVCNYSPDISLISNFKQSGVDKSSDHMKNKSLIVDGVNLDEIKEFARHFKMKRISLGLTQTQVGQALTASEGPAYSQSAICRFEKLDITPKSAQRIKPVLEKWLIAAEEKSKMGNGANGEHANSDASRKRKRRTSFNPHALELLNEHFEKNPHPTGSEMSIIANSLNYDREVIRVWFCNKRQALKNTIKRIRTHEDQYCEFEEDISDHVSYCSNNDSMNPQII